MTIKINIGNLEGKGFAEFIKDSAKKGNPQIIIDIDAMLNSHFEKEIKFKQMFSECVLREIFSAIEELFGHGIEELFDKIFDEKKLNKLFQFVRKMNKS